MYFCRHNHKKKQPRAFNRRETANQIADAKGDRAGHRLYGTHRRIIMYSQSDRNMGAIPEKIEVTECKHHQNAMGVGIPGTGMNGLPISIALGALRGRSEDGLELLKDLTPDEVASGKRYIAEKRIHIHLKEQISDKLFIEVHCTRGSDFVKAIIRDSHTSFTYIEKNGKILLEKSVLSAGESSSDVILTFRKIYDYAVSSHVEELHFILDAARMNKEAAQTVNHGQYGHNVSKNLLGDKGIHLFGDNLHTRMVASTAGACDVRMAGAPVPVMSNSGSGNQGIAPHARVTYAEQMGSTTEQLIRALILSNLTMIYIKQHIGRLSALCGCVVASTGASCGITLLMGGNYDQITFATKNMIANITGMICDGAKPSCALKIASGVSTATLSALMAIENEVVSAQEGIIDNDIDQTIRNLARIGTKGMVETDKIVLDILTQKQ